MKTERIFNLFLFVNDNLIREIGVTVHQCGGSDDDKTRLLQEKVHADYRVCQRFPLPDNYLTVRDGKRIPRSLSYGTFLELQKLNRHMDLWEHVMQALDASEQPLLCVTPIVDGIQKVERVTDLTPALAPLPMN